MIASDQVDPRAILAPTSGLYIETQATGRSLEGRRQEKFAIPIGIKSPRAQEDGAYHGATRTV